ncbi:9059_t:CDS:2 [Entrophospora sp. SA101]|nr:3727_t:CDS:2 [Entrophospora sp. SA101]CAJ0867842.1 9059_t:CDS:2 [Entrophospora sp. SA101]
MKVIAGSSSESSSFSLHKVDASLHAKQPDIYFCDDILKVEPGEKCRGYKGWCNTRYS